MSISFNLIGPGRVGKTLTHLWQRQGAVVTGAVVARQAAHAEAALAFIGAGVATTLDQLPPARVTLLAVPDDAIEPLARQLAMRDWQAGDIVFHCSGSLSSVVLAPLAERGVSVASIHPLKSFADPTLAVQHFAGTWCACEGDAVALATLESLFDCIGARRFRVDPQGKTLYHAAAVLACNDLVALMEAALCCMEAAGVARDQAWQALRPLVDGTLRNLDAMPTREALTGPVARGDVGTVQRQLAALEQHDGTIADGYRALSRIALRLADLDEVRRAALVNALGERA